jgi:GntR family transcriptional repressor for pyruvate dehydrogenase complex
VAFSISEFRPARGMTLSSQIVARIRDALFAGELKPGDVLGSEGELARKFGVSRMSVRDALRSLEAMGIVDIKMGSKGGATIAEGHSERFADALAIQLVLIGVTKGDVLEARAAIESMSANLAAKHATPQDKQHMADLLDAAANNVGNPAETQRLGEEFHMAIAEASHNKVLVSQLQAFRDVLWQPDNLPDEEKAKRILQVHGSIFEYIERGEHGEAGESMAEHLRLIRRERQVL